MPVPGDLIGRAQKQWSNLSAARRRIVEFLVNNWAEAAFMTASEIGQKCDSSESVVIRVAQSLGYSGYPELQATLRKAMLDEISLSTKIQMLEGEQDDNPVSLSFAFSITQVQKVRRNNPAATFEKVAKALTDAGSVCVSGGITAQAPALFLGQNLLQIRPNVYIVPGPAYSWQNVLKFFGKGDVFVCFSFEEGWEETMDALKYAHDKGVTCVVILEQLLLPSAKLADMALVQPVETEGGTKSFTGCFSILDAILALVIKNFSKQAKRKNRKKPLSDNSLPIVAFKTV